MTYEIRTMYAGKPYQCDTVVRVAADGTETLVKAKRGESAAQTLARVTRA